MNKFELNDAQKKALEKFVIILIGKITEDTLHYVQECVSLLCLSGLHTGKYPDLTLLISTSGGCDSEHICDMLNLYPGRIIGLVFEKAFSAGSIILQVCDLRYATPNSEILIHHGTESIPADAVMDENKLPQSLKRSRDRIEKMYSLYQRRAKISKAEIIKLCFESRRLSVDEALDFGLIDEIWAGPLPVSDKLIKWPEDQPKV